MPTCCSAASWASCRSARSCAFSTNCGSHSAWPSRSMIAPGVAPVPADLHAQRAAQARAWRGSTRAARTAARAGGCGGSAAPAGRSPRARGTRRGGAPGVAVDRLLHRLDAGQPHAPGRVRAVARDVDLDRVAVVERRDLAAPRAARRPRTARPAARAALPPGSAASSEQAIDDARRGVAVVQLAERLPERRRSGPRTASRTPSRSCSASATSSVVRSSGPGTVPTKSSR